MHFACSESAQKKNLEVGECVGRLMILFNGLRPSFPHFATPANKNSEISEIFRDSIKFSAFFRDSWTLKSTHSVCFQLLLWNLLTFSLKNWENIYLKGYHMFSCLGRRAICNIFLIVQQFHFVCKLFSECVHCTTSNGIVMSLMHGSALLLAMFFSLSYIVEQFNFVRKIFGGCVQTLMEGKQKERGQPTYPLGPADFNTS